MKLWDKGFKVDKAIEEFTVGRDLEFDAHLAKFDARGSKAHAEMLASIGLISKEENDNLQRELDAILEQIEKGEFVIEDSFEDVHSKIEHVLTEKLGDTGKKIHTARSRNDQVLVDIHQYVKHELNEIVEQMNSLFEIFLKRAEESKDKLLPGYTHLQIAMPSSFGMWFAAYAENLVSDAFLFEAAYKTADQNPLGSAAGYGSSFPIDRQKTTELLGFAYPLVSAASSQMLRGKLEKYTTFAIAGVASTLNKLATDVCLYNSQNFGFIKLPSEYTTGSSIMPHKKNPDVFELVRAKTNQLQALPTSVSFVTTNMPSGYHRDFQVLKEYLIPPIAELKNILNIVSYAVEKMQLEDNLLESSKYDLLFSVENVNKMVNEGMTFREAYIKIGKQVEAGEYTPERTLNHTHLGSIGDLGLEVIKEKWDSATDFVSNS